MRYTVYTRWGEELCKTSTLEYNGTWMGERFLSVTIKSPSTLNLVTGCYIEYRGERYELNYNPKPTMIAKAYTRGDGFSYDNVKFNSLAYELVRCRFEDYVLNDNEIFTSKPIFSFYAPTVQGLADRIQANLNRLYGKGVWTVICNAEYATKTNVNVSVSNINVSEALALAYSKFGATYSIRNRTITIGKSGNYLDKIFQHGDGLIKISEVVDSDKMQVTRVKAYGSTKNMPYRYYNGLLNPEGKPYLPDAMNIDCLMLPSFPAETLDPYIDNNSAIVSYGVREATIFFDGSMESSDGLPEIFPTIEGLTKTDLNNAGISCDLDAGDNGNLDEIASATPITDNGVTDANGEIAVSDFVIYLKDIGFDINDYTQSAEPKIAFKDGMLGGREFTINAVTKEGNKYRLVCQRVLDSGLGLFFPNNPYNAKAGDKFVLTGINMPDVYIKVASVRMKNLAQTWLIKQLGRTGTYEVDLSAVMMARQHDEAVLSGGVSLYLTIHEGDIMPLLDGTMIISEDRTIDTLTITEGADPIPTYKITLNDDKSVSGVQAIQNRLTELEVNGTSNVDENLIRQHIRQLGGLLFLSKKTSDTAEGLIKFKNGAESDNFTQGQFAGTGWGAYEDVNGDSVIEADRVIVRKTLEASELLINQISFTLGDTVFSCGGCEITSIEENEEYYRCFYDNKNKTRYSGFQVGDGARSQVFDENFDTTPIRYSWRKVVAVGEDYVDISKLTGEYDEGSVAPEVGDNLVQFGHENDATRQNAIVIGSGNTPRIYQYAGITLFNVPEPQTRIEPNNSKFSGAVHFEAGSTGADNIADLPDEVQGIVSAQEFGKANLLRNTSFTGDYLSRQLSDDTTLNSDSEMFSPSMEHWKIENGTPTVVESPEAVSGYGLQLLSGAGVSQVLFDKMLVGESYVLSYNLNGYEPTFEVGGYVHNQVNPSARTTKVVVTFKASSTANTFKLRQTQSGCTISDIQLERGTIPSTYGRSVYDNNSSLAYYDKLEYLKSAMTDGRTVMNGGLILSSIILLGRWIDGVYRQSSGMSGYDNENDVAFWAGGSYEQAISTVSKYINNPQYQPTEDELATMAKFVAMHNGRVILEDAIIRGYVYAEGGKFSGEVSVADGKIMLKTDGSGRLANGKLYWDSNGALYQTSQPRPIWRSPYHEYENKTGDDIYDIDLDIGTYIDAKIGSYLEHFVINLPSASLWKNEIITVRVENQSRSSGIANFSCVDDDGILVQSSESATSKQKHDEVTINYMNRQTATIISTYYEQDNKYLWLVLNPPFEPYETTE